LISSIVSQERDDDMSFSMKSKTKVSLTEQQINTICQTHFGKDPIYYKEVVNGFYAAIYILQFKNKKVVLKVAPSSNEHTLTYEEDIMKREVKVYHILSNHKLPVRKVLCSNFNKDIISSDYYIMEFIEGDNLFGNEHIDKDIVYNQLMEYMAVIHNVKMDHFGYDNLQVFHPTMSETYLTMMNNLFIDLTNIHQELPDYLEELMIIVKEKATLLDNCIEPHLLHFDLWEGNVLVKNNEITGLLDAERSLNGDPIMDFVTLNINIFDEENKKYIDVYNQYAAQKITLDSSTYTKYILYKVYLFFIMYVESFYRDIDGSFTGQRNWCINELKQFKEVLQQ